LPGTKTLDYLGLGLLLATPAVVVDMYVRGSDINWHKVAIAAVASCAAGGFCVWASHWWQAWRTANNRLLPYLATFENRFWGKAVIVATAIGFALVLRSLLATEPPSAQQTIADLKKAPPAGSTPESLVTSAQVMTQFDTLRTQIDALKRENEALKEAQKNTLSIGPPAPPQNLDTPKVYTKRTLAELKGFYAGRTILQGNIFMADEVGKWIDIDGVILDIYSNGNVLFQTKDNAGAECTFDNIWKPKLSVFHTGENIKVTGKLAATQGPTMTHLEGCSLRD
jgi:hypothetical protein